MRKVYTLAVVVLCLGLLITPERVVNNPTALFELDLSTQNSVSPPVAQAAAMDPIPDGDIRNCSAPCGAGDVTVSHIFIGTSPTNPITTCTPGTTINGSVYVEIASGNMGDRSAIRFAADLYIGGVFYATYLDCYSGPLMNGQTHVLNVGAISWICGPEIELRDIKVAWTTHGDPCSSDQTCMDYPGGQCWQQMSFGIEAPLSTDFTFDCGNTTNSINFTSQVTGGSMAYTYAWDFGDGTTSTVPNPVHTFPSVNTYTVKLVVTDNGSQMAMSSHDVDLSLCCQPPTITCPADVTISCGASTNPTATGTATATNGCGTNTLTNSDQTVGAAPCARTITRTWTVTDESSNSDICTQTISILPAPPADFTSRPPDITISCGSAPSPTSINYDNSPTGSCSIDGSTLGVITGSHDQCGGSYTETWTLVDPCGRPNVVYSRKITVSPAPAPVFSSLPVDISLDCSLAPPSTSSLSYSNNQSAPCLISGAITSSIAPGITGPCGTFIETWSGTDACGNALFHQRTIRIVDNTLPTIIPPANITIQCYSDLPACSPDNATASDNCGVPVVTCSDGSLSGTECAGSVIRTFKATDACGNSSIATQTIIINDKTNPVITCPPAAFFDCTTGDAGTATATDNCTASNAITITSSDNTILDNCGLGTIQRTWKAVDCNNNSSTCIQTITLQDNAAPTITCPANITFNCALGVAGVATATDNCTEVANISVTSSDSSSLDNCGLGTIARTWTAMDCKGNSSSCIQIITLQDVTAPTFSCPANITFNCLAGDAGEPNPTDNCTAREDIMLSSSDASTLDNCGLGTILRTWTARDCVGNQVSCRQTIVIQDVTPPSIICPRNITFDCAIGDAGTATATDNCSPVNFNSFDFPLLDNCGLGLVLRTWYAYDCAGLSSTCVQTIVIQDVTPPEITCPSDVTFQCTMGDAGSAIATDNCTVNPVVTSSDASNLDLCGLGTVTRTWTAKDCKLNAASCVQTITIRDNNGPQITCPSNVIFSCQQGNSGMAVATDNCGVPTVTFNDVSDLDYCGLGTIMRTWTAKDCAMNASSCLQVITIQDITPPSITCPADVRFECSIQDAGQPTVSDNCTLNLSPTMSDDEDLSECGTGTILRTWSVADCAGQSASCLQTIEIYDETAPVLICPANVSISCEVSFVPADPIVTDNCDANPTVTQKQIGEFDGCSGTGTVIFRYIATDACGNQDSCDQMVTIFDNKAPVFVGPLPADITVSCGEVPVAPRLDATDNCSEPFTQLDESEQPLDGCPIISRITRTWTAYDACGNTAKHTQVISIQDNKAPILASAPVNLCDQSMTYTEALDTKFPALTFYDECTGQNIVSPEPVVTYDCFNSKFELAYTAADQCGNVANFVQDVCIDYMPPMCTIRPGQTLYCGGVGSLRAEIMGGIGPFTYMWMVRDNDGWEIVGDNNLEEVFLRSNLSSARIGLMITDATGCGSYCEYYTNCTNWEACAVDSRMYSMYNGMFCDMSSMYYKLEDIFKPGPITIGIEGERSFTVDWDHYNCLYALLSMQGEPQPLLPGDGTFNSDCFASTIQLQHVKSSANALANEALTLAMNMRLDTLLPHVAFFDYCVITSQAADCSQDHPFSVLPNTLDTLCLPESISNELDHWPITAQEILEVGNRALAGETVQITYQDLTRALHMVNETFNNCRKIMRYGTYDVPMSADIVTMTRRHGPCSMVAYPNPATETSVLQINLDQKREVHLEVFDAYGKSYYQTDFEGIRGTQTKVLDLKRLKPGMYFIQMNSGELSINTKLLKVN